MTRSYINNWHRIWSNRAPSNEVEGSVLQRLVTIDGFDSPLGCMKEDDWRTYVALLAQRTGISEGDSIFEVGCGSGAFLYPFYIAGHDVSGIDYSLELIQMAQSAMPRRMAFFDTSEACACPVDPRTDVVLANHVIHYFSSVEYASAVVDRMLAKAVKVVCISGIPNLDLKSESERERRGLLGNHEYQRKYRDLEILYYDRNWFVQLSDSHGFVPRFFDHDMPGFAQNRFRYDCVMTRA